MENGDPRLVARTLLNNQGPPEAWQHSMRVAIEAQLRHDSAAAAHWVAVQEELKAIAPRPGAGDLDIYRSARALTSERGAQGAWRHAMQQGVAMEGDLAKQAYWLRVADAVNALAQGYGKEGA